MMKPNSTTERIIYYVGHTVTDKYKGHVQEMRYVGSAAGHHLVKVFSSANWQGPRRTTIRHFLANRFVRSHGCVLTRPVTRRMRRRVSISFCRRPSLSDHRSTDRWSMRGAVDYRSENFLLSYRIVSSKLRVNKFDRANQTTAINKNNNCR